MSNIYLKKQDVLRALFNYLESGKSLGDCIDEVTGIDMEYIVAELKELRTGENYARIDAIIREFERG